MPTKAYLGFCIFLFFIKMTSVFYTDFDLFGDEAQYWLWSKELDFGYYSKPPLLAWFISLFTLIFGNNFEAIKALPITLFLLSSFAVFLFTLKIYRNFNLAVITAIVFYLLPAVTVSSFLVSTDILLIMFWPFSLLYFLKIRDVQSLQNFVLLGIFIGLMFMSKYAAIYFILGMIVIIFFDREYQKIFIKKIHYFFILFIIILLILLPNIIWNYKNGWITLYHTSDNAAFNRMGFNPLNGIGFVVSQLIMLGPICLSLFFLSLKKNIISFETKFLLSFSIPIFFIVFIESILVRANANWAAAGMVSLLVLLVNIAYTKSKKIINATVYISLFVGILFFLFLGLNTPLRFFDRINGITPFSKYVEDNYLKTTKTLVVGDRLLFSNMKYILRNKGIEFFIPYNPSNKIKNHFELSRPLDLFFNKTFIFLGHPHQIQYLKNEFKIKKIDTKKVKFKKNEIEIYEVFF